MLSFPIVHEECTYFDWVLVAFEKHQPVLSVKSKVLRSPLTQIPHGQIRSGYYS